MIKTFNESNGRTLCRREEQIYIAERHVPLSPTETRPTLASLLSCPGFVRLIRKLPTNHRCQLISNDYERAQTEIRPRWHTVLDKGEVGPR